MLTFLVALHGCAAPPSTSSNKPQQPNILDQARGPLNTPAGVSQTLQVVASVLPLGMVPYDNASLPLLSADGRYIAVQAGAPPTWPTVLAEPAAEIPSATRIEIYELDWRDEISAAERKPPALVGTLNEPLILGRFSDAQGFLVESVREDGSRWIGKVAWDSGANPQVAWLVSDSNINAFAAIGPNGRLAWCRRAKEAMSFELVVRNGSNEIVMPLIEPALHSTSSAAASEEDPASSSSTRASLDGWLVPTWSGKGDTLFALYLERGQLSIRYMIATSDAAVRQSMRRLMLASDCDIHIAYQTVSAQPSTVFSAASAVTSDQIIFFHPRLGRAALWRPLALADQQRIQLNASSIAALVDQDEYAFVTITQDGGHLVRQNLRNPQDRLNLVAGVQIPRQITSPTWPYILVNPIEGHFSIMAMRLLPRDQSVFTAR